jgi:hypothetical protein
MVVRNAIAPPVSIMKIIENWSQIKKKLSEGRRRRKTQLIITHDLLNGH